MKSTPYKAFPYPVLRPDSDDYPRSEFQFTPQCERIRGETSVRIKGKFDLGDDDLQRLVSEGSAEYVLWVASSSSRHRSAHRQRSPEIEIFFESGQLSQTTTVTGFVVATEALSKFTASGWNDDYEGLTFDIPAGGVLALDADYEYTIDTAEEAPISSIFEVVQDSSVADGTWRCMLNGERVAVIMSPRNHALFDKALSEAEENLSLGAYIMNAVYLPALVWVLQVANEDEAGHGQLRWYRSLNARLADHDCKLLGTADNTDRLNDAQKLLEQPFAGLPFITAVGGF